MRYSLLLMCVVAAAHAMAAGPVPMQQFAPPAEAAAPVADYSGHYRIHVADAAGFKVHNDRFGYEHSATDPWQFPGVQLDLLQVGKQLFPAPAGIIDTGHAAWEVAVQPT